MNQPEYSYERKNGVWAVVRWRKTDNGAYEGEGVNTHILRDDARREVFRLNGWQDSRLEFSYNWNNKLHNKAFTTIRLWNEKKYCMNSEFDVYLHNFRRGRARLVSVKRIRLDQVNEYIARLDMGCSADECKRLLQAMYKNRGINWDRQYLAYCLFVFLDDKTEIFR